MPGFLDSTGLSGPQLAPLLGLLIGLAFGALAEATRFCLRRALAGPAAERKAALGVWMAALGTAVIGTQTAVAGGLIAFDAHRFHAADLPFAAILAGGLMFGAGMVLARGCLSRLTVLSGSGNLRAALVLLVAALAAHATLKGALAPLRTGLGEVTLPAGRMGMAALPGNGLVWAGILALGAFSLACCSGAPRRQLALAVLLGLLVPAAWLGTGILLADPFDPVPLESLSFTGPAAETAFWWMAATAIGPGFGVGLIGGALAGAFLSARLAGRFRWESFEGPRQTGRYLAGAGLMGVGGVLAGGCTVGAGLSGLPTLGSAAVLALFAITLGARAAATIPAFSATAAPAAR